MERTITPEQPDTPDAMALVEELEAELAPLYPSESRHGLSVEQLLAQNVAFFVLRADGTPAACGGVKLWGQEYAEVKRMYVRPQFRGIGLSRHMLEHLEGHAREQGVGVLRLETGIHQLAAIALYERFGFGRIPPFGAYREDPNSVYFEKRLD